MSPFYISFIQSENFWLDAQFDMHFKVSNVSKLVYIKGRYSNLSQIVHLSFTRQKGPFHFR